MKKLIDKFLYIQNRYALLIVLVGVICSVLAFPRAIKLLGTIATDLIHLLPDNYPSVKYTDEVKKKFDRRSSLFLILNSPSQKTNFKAMKDLQVYLEKDAEVDYVAVKKRGFSYIEENKLMLVDLKDLYKIKSSLKDYIHKKKLGGLYIDFEDDTKTAKDAVGFEELLKKYKEQFAEGVQSKYRQNADGTVYVLDIYPKSADSSLKYFKKFGEHIDQLVKKYDMSQYGKELKYGYAGAIKTRVDQYNALIEDLKQAGIFSGISIFLLLYLYFGWFLRSSKKGIGIIFKGSLWRLVPVLLVFGPMIMSTLFAFWFNAFFFSHLNVVTSFLFAIIFGLGVDIGIHLFARFVQDRSLGLSLEEAQKNVVVKTGLSALIAILTTVASFYVLIVTDFKGFSEFGWIAGNGLVIALATYMIFLPAMLVLVDRYHLLKFDPEVFKEKLEHEKRHWIPKGRAILITLLLIAGVSIFAAEGLEFEWNFSKLKMRIEHREAWKAKLKETTGRVNSPAVYLVENPIEARAIAKVIRHRQENDKDFDTINFYRSYYDMFPTDQDEKMVLLKEIDKLLADDALNALKKEDKKLVNDFRKEIKSAKKVRVTDVPKDMKEIFWGNTGITDTSVAYIQPLFHLELDNGNNAREFYHDVHHVNALGKDFYAISDSMIFAEVLIVLFRDAKLAISLAVLILFVLISAHFRDVKRTAIIFIGLACGIVWMLALMEIFDFKLNFYNMIIIPAMMGMGVDNSVHIVHRFDELKQRSIWEALKTSGGAALMASLTTILGYAGMCTVRHPGLQSIGWMAIIGMGTCLIGSLVVTPLLLQVVLGKDVAIENKV